MSIVTHKATGVRILIIFGGWATVTYDPDLVAKLRAEYGTDGTEHLLRFLLDEARQVAGFRDDASREAPPRSRTH